MEPFSDKSDARVVWEIMTHARVAYDKARWLFLYRCDKNAQIDILKNACSKPESESIALLTIDALNKDEQIELLCPLLQLVIEANIYSEPRPDTIILSLPTELVMARIKACIEVIQQKQDYDEIQNLLSFLQRFNRELAIQVAHDLTQSSKQHIRGVGEDCIKELKPES